MSQQQHPPFTCWVEFSNKKDELTFENTANYNRLIPVIRGSKQLAVGDGSIDLFSDAAKTIQLDVETPVDRNLQRIYVATTQPLQEAKIDRALFLLEKMSKSSKASYSIEMIHTVLKYEIILLMNGSKNCF
ncbi:hypothetical protein PPL_04811 [Heterostelium album PN500]|uniref:Uncharacterized protein n=1 Tax=Heterostelium pallidum (strain ATCC 26659 / Pp 5 / PN500) TaxID=670386 RepID=D3B8L8_HETP5|nr:hypothetical protein PPL_04811 [Heterostelium album PN500]EFA82386.1 hypothetical protein PPL_04811 [Heterostelium album PN500]|eukprot:XP_020434503.1 hypothetical protein PPL_04811 [Heterostelium album PN500]